MRLSRKNCIYNNFKPSSLIHSHVQLSINFLHTSKLFVELIKKLLYYCGTYMHYSEFRKPLLFEELLEFP